MFNLTSASEGACRPTDDISKFYPIKKQNKTQYKTPIYFMNSNEIINNKSASGLFIFAFISQTIRIGFNSEDRGAAGG